MQKLVRIQYIYFFIRTSLNQNRFNFFGARWLYSLPSIYDSTDQQRNWNPTDNNCELIIEK